MYVLILYKERAIDITTKQSQRNCYNTKPFD